jgi:hypothetical protein
MEDFVRIFQTSTGDVYHITLSEDHSGNNSYFLGSVKSAKRFARLVSLTQSAKNCKRNVQKYFHDILNRVVVTVKDELVNILPHKWDEPVTIPLVY